MPNFSRWKKTGQLALASAVAIACTNVHSSPKKNDHNDYIPGEFLIQYRSEPALDNAHFLNKHGLKKLHRFGKKSKKNALATSRLSKWEHVEARGIKDLEKLRKQLMKDPNIARVEYNYRIYLDGIPNDPLFTELWGLNNIGQNGGVVNADIDVPEAWDQIDESKTTIVGVIDTGVWFDHPDLIGSTWTNPGEVPGNGIDDDENGYIDDIHGYDFVNLDGDPTDDHGHGTHVAGTIAATVDNGVGVAGVARNTQIMALKIFDQNGGSFSGAVQAVEYAIAMGAQVTNNSWGGGPSSQLMRDAIESARDANQLFIAAAGNNYGNDNDSNPHYPSSYDLDNIIAVAATNNLDQIASFSNVGQTSVDIAAPGQDIFSTMLSFSADISNPTGYGSISGTSMATPHVTGAVACLLSSQENTQYLTIRNRILGGAKPNPSLAGLVATNGTLNLLNATEEDTIPPVEIYDLTTTQIGSSNIGLKWSASGDDGEEGEASSYIVAYSTDSITEENFDALAQQSFSPIPGSEIIHFTVPGLTKATSYFVAVKAVDNYGNRSGLSNIIFVTTNDEQTVYTNTFDSIEDWTVVSSNLDNSYPKWGLTTHRFGSPGSAIYYGNPDTLNYDNGAAHSGSITSPDITLPKTDFVALRLSHYLETENVPPYDEATIRLSNDNGLTWNTLFITHLSNAADMAELELDLTPYAGETVQFQFSFDTKDSIANQFEGWVIDDFRIITPLVNYDLDGDGVHNEFDLCPDTPIGDPVDENGCSILSLGLVEFSLMPSRDNSEDLNGKSFSSDTTLYIFADVESGNGISSVDFYLDGMLYHTEKAFPYDFAGTAGSNSAPYSLSKLSNGEHAIEVVIHYIDNTQTNDVAVFKVVGVIDSDQDGVNDEYDLCPDTPIGTIVDEQGCPLAEVPLVYSFSNDRSSPLSLLGANLSIFDTIYIFVDVANGDDVKKVEFRLNGQLVQTENYFPYDYKGGSANSPNPLNVNTLSIGTHEIESTVYWKNGGSSTQVSSFTVN